MSAAGDAPRAPILPGATIGILGGGQLGRMMALAGRVMGYRFVCLDPTPDGPCGQVCDDQLVAALDDVEAARELARRSDVVTYEFENVAPACLEVLAGEGYAPQGAELLQRTRHRRREKEAITAAGYEVAPYAPIRDEASLAEAFRRLGTPAVLKTATGGYDGKGQRLIRDPDEVARAYRDLAGAGELVLEAWVPFEAELSVVVARNPQGEVCPFPVTENLHVDNVLHRSLAPSRAPFEVEARAQELATGLAEALGLVGVMGVELFLTSDGALRVNELAPRPHNSGHLTIDACPTSQFEQHLRAICGLPLGPARQATPAVMVNLLGRHLRPYLEAMARPTPEAISPKTHLYGKAEARPQRKMGHVNVLGPSVEAALAWIEASGVWAMDA